MTMKLYYGQRPWSIIKMDMLSQASENDRNNAVPLVPVMAAAANVEFILEMALRKQGGESTVRG